MALSASSLVALLLKSFLALYPWKRFKDALKTFRVNPVFSYDPGTDSLEVSSLVEGLSLGSGASEERRNPYPKGSFCLGGPFLCSLDSPIDAKCSKRDKSCSAAD